MGKHFALALQLPGYRLNKVEQKRKTQSATAAQEGSRNLSLMVAGIALVLFFAYLFQVNSFSTKGYEIKQMQRKVTNLREENKQLQIQSAQLESIQRIQGDPQSVNMVPVSSISYIKTTAVSER